MTTDDDIPASPAKAVALMVVLGVITLSAATVAFSFTIRYLNATHAGTIAETAATILYGAVIVGLAAWLAKVAQKVTKTAPSAAWRRYRRRQMTAMGLYVLALIGAMEVYRSLHPTGPLAYGTAILPALPILGVIVAIGLYLREETDEFERGITAEAALWASGGLLVLATVWGFLEMFGLAPHVESWAAFPIWAIFLLPGNVIARRRYR